MCLTPPALDCDPTWNAVPQGSPLGALPKVHHGYLLRAHTKFQTRRRKAGFSINRSVGLFGAHYHLGNGRSPRKFLNTNLVSSKGSILGSVTLPLFCTVMNSIVKMLSLMHLSCLSDDVH